MPKQILKELDQILNVLEKFVDGADIKEIRKALKTLPSLRTLQRRLKTLEMQGRLSTEGKTRGKKYRFQGFYQQKKQSKGSVLILSKVS